MHLGVVLSGIAVMAWAVLDFLHSLLTTNKVALWQKFTYITTTDLAAQLRIVCYL